MGCPNRVTVDRHAAAIVGESDADLGGNGKAYAEIEAAYAEAAMLRGVTPAQMQAITWCIWRGTAI
jgi:hypothetical protein